MTSASASRVTRSSRNLRLAVLLFAGVLSVMTVLRAQESAPAPAGTPAAPTSGTAAAAANASRNATPDGESSAQPAAVAPDEAATAPAPKGPSPSRFEPTEKVRADFDVSFPIDI